MGENSDLFSRQTENSEKTFPGEMQGRGEYSDLFSKNKTLKKYSLGKGRARESIQICFPKRKL